MEIIYRDACVEDMEQVLLLIKELATFEKEDNAVEVTVEDLVNDGFGEKPLFHCFVAAYEKAIVGIALIYSRYSTWKGPAVHLEDLIVSKEVRGKGIGNRLLAEVVKYAHNKGVKRVCWEVLDWNEPAIDFYESKGANVMRDWDVVHLNEKGIQNFIMNIK